MVDDDLQLIPPSAEFIDDVIAACQHPLTLAQSPELGKITRQGLLNFLETAPSGQHSGDLNRDCVPSYHFWMKLTGPDEPVKIAGGIGLRIGNTVNLRHFMGHMGYNVYPPARGRHLAERACRLLLPLARHHEMKTIWITCNPENIASKRTCERLGAMYVDTVDVPPDNELHARGEVQKCRFRLDL